jgi:hypothetical protein
VDEYEREMFRHLPWPFPDGRFPTQLGALVQATVLSGEQPARLVIHSSDNDWLIGDGINDPNGPGGSIATHLGHVLNGNSSLATLADLPPGWEATRTAPGSPWHRTTHAWLE